LAVGRWRKTGNLPFENIMNEKTGADNMKDQQKNRDLQVPAKKTGNVAGKKTGKKKPFIKPKLTRHDDLPVVTTGFVGTYNP